MKTPQPRKGARTQGFTLIELLVVISIIAILAGFALKAFPAAMKRARLTESLNNAKQTLLSLKMFSTDNDGLYPATQVSADGGKTPGTPLADGTFSDRAFDNLIPRYASSKIPFANKASKYCKGGSVDTSSTDAKTLRKGQNDWLYVTSMTDTSDGRWPLIGTAGDGATPPKYTSNKNEKGGVWEGTDAIIGFTDGSAKSVSEKDMVLSSTTAPFTSFVKSPLDGANIFAATAEWLGTDAKILSPEPSGN